MLLHRFLAVNTIGIATNLLPFVGLDGALLFADAIGHPDLPYRTRTALTRRNPGERWILAYSAANAAVAAGLLVMAGYFWWQLLGDLTMTLWSHGPAGAAAVLVLYTLVGRDLWTLCSRALLQSWTHVSRIWNEAVFRCERRWRVEAINAFRALPELASLGSAELGIIAGRLQRCSGRTLIVPTGTSHLYLRPSLARRHPLHDPCVVPVTEWHTLPARAIRRAVALPLACATSPAATAPQRTP